MTLTTEEVLAVELGLDEADRIRLRMEMEMTMPDERSRAVVQTRDFLVNLSRDSSLPEKVRNDAKFLLRHFPSRDEVILAGRIEEQSETLPLGAMGPVFSSTFKEFAPTSAGQK